MATLKIYRSSAGAGKTHTLVCAYLEQALKSPTAFSQILAVTFTNQSTQEMKQRILLYLHHLAEGIPSPATKTLLDTTTWDNQELKKRAQKVLSNILHQYAHFSVSTIDSFFQKIIRGFAQELGLQSGFQIELNQGYVLEQLIHQLVDTADQDLELQQWLIAFSEDKLLNGKHWNFQRELMTLGQEIFSESFGKHEADLSTTAQHKTLQQFMRTLHTQSTIFENTIRKHAQQAIDDIQQAGLSISDFAYGSSGVAGYLAGLTTKKPTKPSKRALKALEDAKNWYSKSSTQKEKIEQVVHKSLMNHLYQIITYYETHCPSYYTAQETQHFIYAFGIVTRLLSQLTEYRAANNIMLIADTASLLHKIISENETPFVYEKMGAFYKHFLIDEFQDISTFQWHNLSPLVKNALDEGYKSLVVGDVKQSIYRWRGGDWQLLQTQLQHTLTQTEAVELTQNWRSKEHIINFNNTLFGRASQEITEHLTAQLDSLANQALKKKLTSQLQQVHTVYKDAQQQLPSQKKTDNKGYVSVTFLHDKPEGPRHSWRETVLETIPTLIETLQQEGIAPEDIALLVRNNAEAREIFQTMLRHQHSAQAKESCCYDIISAESLYLGQNPCIRILISALYCLVNEEDTLAQTELTYLYQTYNTSQGNSISEILLDQRIQLLQNPLYELIEILIDLLGLYQETTIPFLQAFKDIILNFSKRELATIPKFLTWWQERGARHTLPRVEGQRAMTLMTIHQAKGLQFKVVLIPFCNWDLDHNTRKSPTLWCHTDQAPFNQFPVLPVRYSSRLKDTIYVQEYYEEQMQAYLDHLNLLYVALTRPEEQLYVFAQKPAQSDIKTVGDLLYWSIIHQQDIDQNHYWKDKWDQERNTLTIGQRPPKETSLPAKKTAKAYKQDLQAHPVQGKHNNGWKGLGAWSKKTDHGKMVHRLLAQLVKSEDLNSILTTFQTEEGLTDTMIEELRQQVTQLLQHPQVKEWFSGVWTTKNEATILAPNGQVLRPDRVLIRHDQAIVLEFKTGEQHKNHIRQVQQYIDTLGNMGYTQINGYLLYVNYGTVVAVSRKAT